MFLPGLNYPWTVFRGSPNYGCDFGVNVWGSHAGVTAHEAEVRDDFARMAAAGAGVVRWFVWTDGRGGVRWTADGRVAGVAARTFDDLDAALEMARDHRVRLCLVLFDFSWMQARVHHDAGGAPVFGTRPGELASPDGRSRVFAGLIDPFVARYGRGGRRADLGPAVQSIDVINEPDWVTRGLAWRASWPWGRPDRPRATRPFTLPELTALVRGVADRVHARMDARVTVGGGRLRFLPRWDDPAFGLDVLQVHLYPDRRRPARDRPLLEGPAAALGVSKPVLVGEFPGNGHRRHPPDHRPPRLEMTDYLAHAREAGFLGAWPWSFKGIDAFGAVDAEAYRRAALPGP